jgi:hypothetical protein
LTYGGIIMNLMTLGLAKKRYDMRRWAMALKSGSGSDKRKEFINKVADKLGMPPDKVAAALQEARRETAGQSGRQRLQQAVENGVITQSEADQVREWWKNRPGAVNKLLVGHMHGGGLGRRGMGWLQR